MQVQLSDVLAIVDTQIADCKKRRKLNIKIQQERRRYDCALDQLAGVRLAIQCMDPIHAAIVRDNS